MSTNIDPGLPVVSHVYTFGEILNQGQPVLSRTAGDEAVRHLPANALAMREGLLSPAYYRNAMFPP